MSNSIYATLTRQSGLLIEMQAIAHNIANGNSTGYKAQGIAFSEFIARTGSQTDSLSMAHARVGLTDFSQGSQRQTDNPLDIAIEGEGYFLLDAANGTRQLTRAGHFTRNAEGMLVSPDGKALLDAGEAPILLPLEAQELQVTSDGMLLADGAPVAQIGLFAPTTPTELTRGSGATFASDDIFPIDSPRMRSGHLESSNVNMILQMSRMIEVQRAYELGQSFTDKEDERLRALSQLMKG